MAADYRRAGVGRKLMDAARHHAAATGACAIELATGVDNYSAQRLYETLGYNRDVEFVRYELGV